MSRNLYTYLLPFLFIASWWSLAFYTHNSKDSEHTITYFHPKKTLHSSHFSPLNKEELRDALTGNWDLVAKLIHEWDIDAELLEERGETMKRLNRREIREIYKLLRLSKEAREKTFCFFPHTYFSASLLLALVDPQWITSLPQGFREELEIYPSSFTNRVEHDVDPFHLEYAMGEEKTLAFVAPFSHPTTLTTLEKRGAHLLSFPTPITLDELEEEIQQVGRYTDEEERAKLLCYFIRAARYNLENRLKIDPLQPGTTCYLNARTVLSLPGEETLVGDFLKLLHLDHTVAKNSISDTPIELEEILQKQPERVILSVRGAPLLSKESIEAFAERNVDLYLIDRELQQTVSQFSLLALFDLCSIALETGS